MAPPFIIILVALIVGPLAWVISTYNKFIKYKNMNEESWSGIDVALKRRYKLTPNLIAATKGYSRHESDVLTRTAETRSATGSVASREEEESRISRSLSGLIALAEAYPDLKASANFLALHNSLDEIEEEIQQARNRDNFSVRKFNTLVESFPSSLIARKFGFERRNFFFAGTGDAAGTAGGGLYRVILVMERGTVVRSHRWCFFDKMSNRQGRKRICSRNSRNSLCGAMSLTWLSASLSAAPSAPLSRAW